METTLGGRAIFFKPELMNEPSPRLTRPWGRVTLERLEQLAKVDSLMQVTVLGIFTAVSPEDSNASAPRLVTPSGMAMFSSLEQSRKAPLPIPTRLGGNSMRWRPPHVLKAESDMVIR